MGTLSAPTSGMPTPDTAPAVSTALLLPALSQGSRKLTPDGGTRLTPRTLPLNMMYATRATRAPESDAGGRLGQSLRRPS